MKYITPVKTAAEDFGVNTLSFLLPSIPVISFCVDFSTTMSGARRISLFLFTSILLIFTILWFSPVSHLPSSLLPKVLSFFKHQEDTFIYESSTYKGVFYYEGSENPGTNSRRKNPVVDEKDVVVLTEKNFSDFIATNPYVMVEFYASWCYWSRKLAPEYSAAATLLKGEAVLAKVEATVEKGLARKYEIQGYPSVFLFAGGVRKDCYYGERTRDSIATWMRQKTGLAVPTVSTTEEAKKILRTNYVIVMGFLDTLEGSDTKELDAASKLHADISFYKTDNADVARLFRIDPQIKPPALVMLKWEAANRIHVGFDGQFTKSEISDFVSTNNFQSTKPEISDSVSTNNAPSVITFTVDDASRVLGNPLWLFSTNHSLELISTFEEAAKAFRDKLVFVYAETDGTDFGLGADLAFQFGLPEGSPRVVALMANGGTYLYHGEMTFDGIKTFAEEFLEDNLSIHSVQISKSALRLPSDSH
uniref:protein disulfide-isomerase n=2 Tax=Salix viminalis TaxID=40686 RepID=A0A6N2LQE9_SALVM